MSKTAEQYTTQIRELLISINSKKEQMSKLQKEVEHKISDLDKLLQELQDNAVLKVKKYTKEQLHQKING